MFDERRGHCLTGPIEVRGAEPGHVLAVHLVSADPGDWGWTAAGTKDTALNRALGLTGAPTWLLWEIDAAAGTATSDRGHTVRTSPFPGVIGMPPNEPGRHSTIPPRAAGGGNIDCRDLTAGATLYLPVTVPGARLHLGDGHAAQGDGEVCGTAIACPMTTVGVTWLQRLHDLDRGTAAALANLRTRRGECTPSCRTGRSGEAGSAGKPPERLLLGREHGQELVQSCHGDRPDHRSVGGDHTEPAAELGEALPVLGEGRQPGGREERDSGEVDHHGYGRRQERLGGAQLLDEDRCGEDVHLAVDPEDHRVVVDVPLHPHDVGRVTGRYWEGLSH